jgi:hypothetical protein
MARAADKTLRVTSVCVENWRNFTTIDAALRRRVFLLGPNASGKSNFLDLFRIEFAREYWHPDDALPRAESLQRFVRRLRELLVSAAP